MQNENSFHYSNFFEDTGIYRNLFEGSAYPWEALSKIDEFIAQFKNSEYISDYTQIGENTFIGHNVLIDDVAKISGKAIIGHNSTIGHGAYIRGGVLIGESVNIGHVSEIKHSIVLYGSSLAHLNYVGDSIIGGNVNLSGGAKIANWRFDKKEVVIKDGNSEIPTHLEKFGSIVGDNSFIGVNSVINPGTVLAKQTIIYPLISVKGTYLEQSVIK